MKIKVEYLVGGLSIIVTALTLYLFGQLDALKSEIVKTQEHGENTRQELIRINNLLQLQLSESMEDDETDFSDGSDDSSRYDSDSDEDDSDVETLQRLSSGPKIMELSPGMESESPVPEESEPVSEEAAAAAAAVVESGRYNASDKANDTEAAEAAASVVGSVIESVSNAGGEESGSGSEAESEEEPAEPEPCVCPFKVRRRKEMVPCGKPLFNDTGYCRPHSRRIKFDN